MIEGRIELARPEDVDAVHALLQRHQLPVDGVSERTYTTLVARHGDLVVGTAALELYPDGALLRSVAVAPPVQFRGLGRTLTTAAIAMAREAGAGAIFLLTTTADRFFPKLGFERIERVDVPASVRTSVEFTSACPSTATVMRLRL